MGIFSKLCGKSTEKGSPALTDEEYYSFENALKELQIKKDDLKKLISEGEIRAFRDEDKMKFKKTDIDNIKQGIKKV